MVVLLVEVVEVEGAVSRGVRDEWCLCLWVVNESAWIGNTLQVHHRRKAFMFVSLVMVAGYQMMAGQVQHVTTCNLVTRCCLGLGLGLALNEIVIVVAVVVTERGAAAAVEELEVTTAIAAVTTAVNLSNLTVWMLM